MSALSTETIQEQLCRAEKDHATLRGRQVKSNNLSVQEEAALKSLEAEIESLKKNIALMAKRDSGE